MKYRSRPVEVEARQWEINTDMRGESGSQLSGRRIVEWVNANGGEACYEARRDVSDNSHYPARIAVRTVNGWAYAAPGHYIVMGDATFTKWADDAPLSFAVGRCRDFYPCDPATFEKRWGPIA